MYPPANQKLTIALDAMGGDCAPNCVIEGADEARRLYPDINFIIYGDEAKCLPLLKRHPGLERVSKFVHTHDAVPDDEKPSIAIRQRQNSSMSLAIKAVKTNEAAGAVSAGNTGALMAMAKIQLRTLPGIDRPAIGGVLPTKRGNCVMLDLGANVSCDENNLFEFAVMGDAFARALLKIKSPSIGILNIGSEEMKGNEVVRNAAALLRESELNLNFHGHVEGNDICEGIVDVIVTDGFSGNIALKTVEGTAKMLAMFLKEAFKSNILSYIGAMLAKPALAKLFKKVDPSMHNGAMFLGLNGIIVKSHGSTNALGFANAIKVAIELAKNGINQKIIEEMVKSGHIPAAE